MSCASNSLKCYSIAIDWIGRFIRFEVCSRMAFSATIYLILSFRTITDWVLNSMRQHFSCFKWSHNSSRIKPDSVHLGRFAEFKKYSGSYLWESKKDLHKNVVARDVSPYRYAHCISDKENNEIPKYLKQKNVTQKHTIENCPSSKLLKESR